MTKPKTKSPLVPWRRNQGGKNPVIAHLPGMNEQGGHMNIVAPESFPVNPLRTPAYYWFPKKLKRNS
jgi:hypothetical protein